MIQEYCHLSLGSYMWVWCCNKFIIIFIMAPVTLLYIDNGFDKPKYILGRLHFQAKRAIWICTLSLDLSAIAP